MRVTKHEHACLRLEDAAGTLVIDPGSFTPALTDLRDLKAVVLTHEHADHWTGEHLNRLREDFPDVPIYGPAGVVVAASGHDVIGVSPGESISVGVFALRFFGGVHAEIHSSIPLVDNVGVLVNDSFYYPGDSYAVPDGVDIDLLAAPVGAPWLRIGDAMDFVLAARPRRAFATHDLTLSAAGRDMGRARLRWAAAQSGGEFFDLEPGDALDL